MNCAARILCVILALMVTVAALPPEARAQAIDTENAQAERGKRPGIFRFLFKNRRQREREAAPPAPVMRILPRVREEPRRERTKPRKQRQADKENPRSEKPRKQRRKRPAVAAAPREMAAVEKAEDAKRVLVVGDFMAGALAKGLAEAFVQNPNIVVVDASRGDSGLVRSDLYDLPGQLPALLQEHKPDAILALLGANDRQSIGTEAGSQELGSDGWRAAYTARVSALADALRATAKPILWVGLAPVKGSGMARDYSAFNGIVREQLEVRGLRYVDVWNGFADEEGKFVAAGPDVNGQPVQLRDSDGLNFTRAGQRKLAFFVERELTEILGGAVATLAAADPAEPSILEPADQAPRIGPMIPLDALAVATGDAPLAGAPPAAVAAVPAPAAAPGPAPAATPVPAPAAPSERGTVAASIADRLVGNVQYAAPIGRADNFAWPAAPIPAAAPPPVQTRLPGPNPAPAPLSPVAAAPGTPPAAAPAALR